MTRRTAIAALTCALTLTCSPGTAAQRAPLVEVDDARGDVRVSNAAGPSDYQRTSIDLLGFKVSTGGLEEPSVRFTFRIRRIATVKEFVQTNTFQVMRVTLRNADPSGPEVSGDVYVVVQHGASQAFVTFPDEESATACYGELPVVLRRKGIVKIDVTKDCIPPGLLTVRAVTSVGDATDYARYSRDGRRVPGAHDLGGTAGP